MVSLVIRMWEGRFMEEDRLLRLKEVLQYIPVGKSTWWAGVRSGRFPPPVRLGPRTTTWKFSAIMKLVVNGEGSHD